MYLSLNKNKSGKTMVLNTEDVVFIIR